MATPWASKREPKLLKAKYLADEEFLLEETRASKLLFFPGPVAWTVLFGALTYLAAAPLLNFPGLAVFSQALGSLGSYLPGGAEATRRGAAIVFLVLVIAGLLWIGVRYLRWMRTVYGVTNRRVLVQRGIVGRDFDEIPVEQVRGVDVRQGAAQRLLGYGTVRVSSETGVGRLGNEDWRGIPKPFRFQKLIEDATTAKGPARPPSGAPQK